MQSMPLTPPPIQAAHIRELALKINVADAKSFYDLDKYCEWLGPRAQGGGLGLR